ncbi:hypothetical protein Tco_0704934 [Tanacetum coccineum]|uniref:Uncharacterized protein n=1 Tax=Tanacetum coccineum TaxID=301880 RepID=A0ABQ4Y567_9ASTR
MACFLLSFSTRPKHILILTTKFMTLLFESCSSYPTTQLDNLEVTRGKARQFHIFFTFTSSRQRHLIYTIMDDDDDDDNVQTSRASTPSPTTYLNSLDPLNYQNYQMPSASEQTDETLFERQTVLLNQTQQMHKEMRGGFKSFGKALKGVFSKKKK